MVKPLLSDPDKAVALVSGVRDVLKDALEDVETALEEHEDEKTIADRLIATYGLEPFLLSSGRLGIHFMELSWSSDTGDETLAKQVRDEIDSCRSDDGTIGDADDRGHLQEWRNTLAEALAEIDAVLRLPHI